MLDIGKADIKNYFLQGEKFPRSCECKFIYCGDESEPDILIASLSFFESVDQPVLHWHYYDRPRVYNTTEHNFLYRPTQQARLEFQTEHAGHLIGVIYRLIPSASEMHTLGGRQGPRQPGEVSNGYASWLRIENIVNELAHM